MKCITDGNCSSYTGNYYTKNAIVKSEIQPISGDSHLLIFRAQGIQRHYLAGFDGLGKVSLLLNDFGYQRLVTLPYDWKHGEKYLLKVEFQKNLIAFSINDQLIIEHADDQISSGMIGFGFLDEGEADIFSLEVEEIN